LLKKHGSKIKYFNEEIGASSRLDGLQAAILSVKLKYLDKWNRQRKIIADEYNKILSKVEGIEVPKYDLDKDTRHVYHQYTIKVKNGRRDELKKYLESKGISSMIYYPLPLHLMKAFDYLNIKKGSLPVAERVSEEVLSLPIYAEINKEKINYIGEKIKTFKLN
jgi:dTDP-4-amino-4,6-dideoxygalactose transaminase